MVLIEPRLMGDPLAATPGLGPQDEMATAALCATAGVAALALLLARLMIAKPARIMAAIAAAMAKLIRARGTLEYLFTGLSLSR